MGVNSPPQKGINFPPKKWCRFLRNTNHPVCPQSALCFETQAPRQSLLRLLFVAEDSQCVGLCSCAHMSSMVPSAFGGLAKKVVRVQGLCATNSPDFGPSMQK